MFSIDCSVSFIIKSDHVRQELSRLHGINSTDKNYQFFVPPVPLNVEALEFPYRGNSQFNIFAKVFLCQMGSRGDTCCYIDNAGRWHKYDSDKQLKLKNYGNCHNDSQIVYAGYNEQGECEQCVNADNAEVRGYDSHSVGPGGPTLGPQPSVT